ncbi:hypothetical protein J7T55_009982 [Diaporthe amygdali]|uniref:uncharacterized protein n=1 Tax=Phomopsis amygdali TaxID=1214568 RepID=UPI0022FE55E1|nr:uncharacterized protein J7T55_009982 [Diaporthe amygdali]KAJ0116831.1 hypothetical protein J7T55_009982 [Diaporthe amygdali]
MAPQGHLWLAATIFSGLISIVASQDTWCGKVYNGSAQIIPGGFMTQPEAASSPLLDVQIATRHSIYVGSETTAELIVDAGLSYYHGTAYSSPASGADNASDTFRFTATVQDNVLVSGEIPVNSTDNLFQFDLTGLTPSASASYSVTLTGSTSSGSNVTAETELFYLPEKTTGSVVKVDRLYGSLLYRNDATGGDFKPVFPYGYYGSYSGYFNDTTKIAAFEAAGFNAVNPVADFADTNMTDSIDAMDQVNLLFQYDMRNSFQNLTSVAEQIPLVKDHPSLLTYYTADEPDGWGYTFESSVDAYNLLASLDKYHPTALVLNCQNYYFKEYTVGADILMEDAYPVGINATFADKWGTPCNLTYGDCGCDNCEGSLLDVPARVDDFHKYAGWIGGSAVTRKPVWAVPQAFSGEGYWARDPTPEETWVMDLLAFNHGAMARLAWIYPPSDVLSNATAKLAKVVTVEPVVDFLTGANPVLVQDGRSGDGVLDAAYWSTGDSSKGVLVGVVNAVNSSSVAPVQIPLPEGLNVSKIASQPWGSVDWSLQGSTLVAEGGLEALDTSYVILQ